jgi:hypothetical protein
MTIKTFDECKQIFEQPTEWSAGLSTPGKGHNGPRFVEAVDTPVKHVPGTFEIEPRAKKSKQLKSPLEEVTSGIPFMMTQQMKAGLADRGLTPEQIRGMTPKQAWETLRTGSTARDTSVVNDCTGLAEVPAPSIVPVVAGFVPTANKPVVTGFVPAGKHQYANSDLHGSKGKPHGPPQTTWIYDHPDQEFYLLVEKGFNTEGERAFFQYHWAGNGWRLGVKWTYAERKVPYQLRALKAALLADPDTEVQIAEGEKDADTLRRLGFVATTNPGGAKNWTEDLTAWLRILGVRRAVLHEDNDEAGRDRSKILAAALSGFARVRVVKYPDTPIGGDVTDWIEEGHTRADLETRIAEAKPHEEEWRRAPIHEWVGKRAPKQEYTVPDRFPAEETGLLSGEGQGGKSTMLLHLCAAHVLGREWLGVVPQQGAAIHVECEDAEKVLWCRLEPIAAHYGVGLEVFVNDLHLFSLRELESTILAFTNKQGIVEPTPAYKRLREMAGDLKPVQITIASVANVFAGSEINRTEVQQFVRTHDPADHADQRLADPGHAPEPDRAE